MPISDLRSRVIAEVRAEMARQRKGQKHLAECLSISVAQVSERLTGKVDFKIGEIAQVADYLGVPVTQFLCSDEDASAGPVGTSARRSNPTTGSQPKE